MLIRMPSAGIMEVVTQCLPSPKRGYDLGLKREVNSLASGGQALTDTGKPDMST